MKQTMELCGACAATMQEGYTVKKTGGGVNNKVTCRSCKKRRYGATYEVEVRK